MADGGKTARDNPDKCPFSKRRLMRLWPRSSTPRPPCSNRSSTMFRPRTNSLRRLAALRNSESNERSFRRHSALLKKRKKSASTEACKESEGHMASPVVVIVGGGFGGVAAAKVLKHAPAEIVLIDRENHNLFQPLLYQVATSVLSPGQIGVPIRDLLRHHKNTTVILGEVVGVDQDRKQVFVCDADRRSE